MNLDELEKNIDVKFKNKALLTQALTHRSYLNENLRNDLVSNERLEFLGDAVLSIIISDFLYQKFPHSPEGDLTNFRAALVKAQTLAKVAQTLRLGDYLFLSHGEEGGGGRNNPGILADTFEAILGAIFLDGGLVNAHHFVSSHLFPILSEIIEKRALRDFKSLLQEKVQATQKVSPIYKVIKMTGPDHSRIFTMEVSINKNRLGIGSGHSKQEAEQEAAKGALEKLKILK